MPLAPATDRISCTNWLSIHSGFPRVSGGAKFTPIWSQRAPVLRMPFSISGRCVATLLGCTCPSLRTVRSTAAKPAARQASPTLTPVPKGSATCWACVPTHCRWRDQSCVTSVWAGAACAEAAVGKVSSLAASAVTAAAAPVRNSRRSIRLLLTCEMRISFEDSDARTVFPVVGRRSGAPHFSYRRQRSLLFWPLHHPERDLGEIRVQRARVRIARSVREANKRELMIAGDERREIAAPVI